MTGPSQRALQGLSPEGLTEDEARRRLEKYGPNRLESAPRRSLSLLFARQFTHFFAIILWAAAFLAFGSEIKSPGQRMGTLGFAIVAVIVVNGIFSFWQEYRAERAIQALKKLLPKMARAMRDGDLREIPVEELVPGDLIELKGGDSIPADCKLFEATAFRVNNSTLTGESAPVLAQDRAFASTTVVSGRSTAVITATGMQTEFGKIARLTQAVTEAESPLQHEIARLSRIIAAFSIATGILLFAIGSALGFSFWATFVFAIGIIVANVPEGLLPTVTLSLAMATQRMAARNALVRHLSKVETLGSATVICTDKTGTLTQNKMRVARVVLPNENGVLERDASRIPNRTAHARLFEGALLCQSLSEVEREGASIRVGDPMEVSLVEFAECAGYSLAEVLTPFERERMGELPFDTDRKRQSVLFDTPHGITLYCKGALENVLPLSRKIRQGGVDLSLDPFTRRRIEIAQDSLADRGYRVLALAHRDLESLPYPLEEFECELVFDGLVGIEDPPRPEVQSAIIKCREARVRVIMVTGDHPHTACAIAREIGLSKTPSPRVITGPELHELNEAELSFVLDTRDLIFARIGADQKMRIVRALQEKGEIVAVTGDGVNDAPALKSADIGIAMGISGTDVAKEAADMILLDDNFASIIPAIEEGRAVFENIRKFLIYILTSNVPEFIPYLAFFFFKVPLALTVIQILAVDLGTDIFPALALGADPPAPDVMRRPPRGKNQKLITFKLLSRAYLYLGPLEALGSMAAFFYTLQLGYASATTACLSTIVVMQIADVFICHDPRRTIFGQRFFGNPLIFLGIAIELLLITWIDYTRIGNRIFGTAAIPFRVWVFALPFAFLMITLEEARKRLSP